MKTTKQKMADAIGYEVQQYEQRMMGNAKAEDIVDIAAQAALDVVVAELESMKLDSAKIDSLASDIHNKNLDCAQEIVAKDDFTFWMTKAALKAAADRLRG